MLALSIPGRKTGSPRFRARPGFKAELAVHRSTFFAVRSERAFDEQHLVPAVYQQDCRCARAVAIARDEGRRQLALALRANAGVGQLGIGSGSAIEQDLEQPRSQIRYSRSEQLCEP